MEALYVFALHTSVDAQTHVGVTEEIWDLGLHKVTGVYGKNPVAGFKPATAMQPFKKIITGDELIDLDEESKDKGRPPTKARSDMDSADVATWLAENPAVRAARILARNEA